MKIGRRASAIGLFAALILALAYLFDVEKWLRGGNGWRWNYEPVSILLVLPLIVAVVVYVGLAVLALRQKRAVWAVLLAVSAATVITVLTVSARMDGDLFGGLVLRTTGTFGTGQYWMAIQVDWANGAWLDWPARMRDAGGHLSNLPPGVPMIYAAAADVLGDNRVTQFLARLMIPYQCHVPQFANLTPGWWGAAALGMSIPLLSALAAIPLFGVARRLVGDRRALLAVLWWPLIPAIGSFSPSWNTFYPWLTLLALWALLRASDGGRAWPVWGLLAGLTSGVGTFLNFAFAPLPLVMGCIALGLAVWRHGLRAGVIRAVLVGAAYGVGLALPWLIFYAASGFTPFDLLSTSFEFHANLERPYAYWVVWHVVDWLLWSGLPLAFVASLSALRAVRVLRAGSKPSEIQVVTLAALIGMLLLTLSGTARGETGRVWILFTPFLLLGAADGLRDHFGSDRSAWLRVTAGQILFLLVFSSVLAGVNTFTRPPSVPDQRPTTRTADAIFSTSKGEALWHLVGWDTLLENETVRVTLTIDPLRQPIWSYVIGGLWVAEDGTTTPAGDVIPRHWHGSRYPTTCWRPPERQSLDLLLRRPPPGDYYLSLAAFGDPGGLEGRLTVTTPSEESVQVGLGPITIP